MIKHLGRFTGSYTNQVAHIENCHLDVFVSTMRIIEWYSIAVQFFLLCMMADPARRPPKKPKGPKAINWNSSYYQTSFDPCKPLREFNPVELVKARKYATEIFARCGSKLVVYFATKYDFPAFGEHPSKVLLYHNTSGYGWYGLLYGVIYVFIIFSGHVY